MGEEHRGKGVNVALGPMTNLGRVAAGGRNFEGKFYLSLVWGIKDCDHAMNADRYCCGTGFGVDPFLSGVASRATVDGMQDAGVIACVKH